jgi:hypothetical protein
MKHLILRGSFNSHRYNKFVFEKTNMHKKNKYIDQTVYKLVEVKNQTVESWPRKLSDKDDSIEMISDFSRRNNKLAPFVKGILILPLFQTCATVITPDDFALANRFGNII